jgi:transcriptional regulator with XRE-family HTH domain
LIEPIQGKPEMKAEKLRSSSGIRQLDHLLDGLYVGDNVIWYDKAGSLASVFCLNFIQASLAEKMPLIYVCFDRSPRNLLEKLGPLSEGKNLTILDCFTHGKGAGADVFLDFYQHKQVKNRCRIICIENPRNVEQVMEAFYGVHKTFQGVVHFVFESLTGMQELWEGEDQLLSFYSHSCPRLYELNTVAYWIIEQEAHSPRLKAQINQIAQVAIDLSVKRGTTSMTILKAEKRDADILNRPYTYWYKDLNINFDPETNTRSEIDLGTRLKELRTRQGLSQTDLAKRVGVTPSTISQVESNLIFPSLPALFKMAEVLAVETGFFLQDSPGAGNPVVFKQREAQEVRLPALPKGSVGVKSLTPIDFGGKSDTYLIEIFPKKNLSSHFLFHKGEEMGFLLSGRLQFKIGNRNYAAGKGDMIYLKSEIPSHWKNPGSSPARLIWMKIK